MTVSRSDTARCCIFPMATFSRHEKQIVFSSRYDLPTDASFYMKAKQAEAL